MIVAFDSNGFVVHPNLLVDYKPIRPVGHVIVKDVAKAEGTSHFSPGQSDSEDGFVGTGIEVPTYHVPVFEDVDRVDRPQVGYIIIVFNDNIAHYGRESLANEAPYIDEKVRVARLALQQWEAGEGERYSNA